MIRFLTELLVCQTWFGQFDELYFILNWLVMRCKLWPELAADVQKTAWLKLYASQVKSVYFNHPSQGNPTNYYLILGPRDKAALPTSQQIPSEASEEPSDSIIHFLNYFFIHRKALLSANQRQCSLNRANVPRTCWVKLFGPRIYLWRIQPTRCMKKSSPN